MYEGSLHTARTVRRVLDAQRGDEFMYREF